MTKSLLPCPFCGGKATVEGSNWYGAPDQPPHYAACNRCEAKVGYDWAQEEGGHSPDHAFGSTDQAVAAWNARAATEGRAITALAVTLFGVECYLPSGIAKRVQQAVEQAASADPIGWVFQHDETGHMTFCANDGINTPDVFQRLNPRFTLCGPAYTTPPAQVTEALRWIAEYADKPEKAARGPHRGMAAIKYVAEQALTAAQQPGEQK